ncbi:MAG: ATPase [Hadesarchaea archaeon]|nr:ATPase [Hadesarchaea archaeon]TEU13735.1 MAG: ATPase [Hadesarchaea archaeon]TKJ25854.1 MAG: ATPase [Hadesarchaea archaeon B3_Hades]
MAIQVVKKDGKTEPFQRQKIVNACTAVGAPADVAAGIADEIEKSARDQIPTSEIRAMVIDRLGKIKQDWAKNWAQHEQTKGK